MTGCAESFRGRSALAGLAAGNEPATCCPCEAAKGETAAKEKIIPNHTKDFFKGGFLAIGILPSFTNVCGQRKPVAAFANCPLSTVLTFSPLLGMQTVPRNK
jgi:hypothetical protein